MKPPFDPPYTKQPAPRPKYNPLSYAQEQRLVMMLDLEENEESGYQAKNRRDVCWMDRLIARGLVAQTADMNYCLTRDGLNMARKLRPNDGLPF